MFCVNPDNFCVTLRKGVEMVTENSMVVCKRFGAKDMPKICASCGCSKGIRLGHWYRKRDRITIMLTNSMIRYVSSYTKYTLVPCKKNPRQTACLTLLSEELK